MNLDCMEMYTNNLTIQKSVNVCNAIVEDIIEYSVSVINEGDCVIDNVIIIDTLKDCLKFVSGSIFIGQTSRKDLNVLEGVEVGCLKPGEVKSICYSVQILCRPESGCVYSDAIAKFYYDPHIKNHVEVMDKRSNCVATQIDIANLKILKNANMTRVSRDSIITYTVEIKNIGTIEARNMLFIDNLANELSLIPGSFEVNCNTINYDDNDISIYVGSLKQDECMIIKYDVTVHTCKSCGSITNQAAIKFNYNLYNQSFGEKIVLSDIKECEVKFGISTFKQIVIDQKLCITAYKKDIEEINAVNVEAKIIECHIINTIKGTSNGGQSLLGYKLVVRGELREIVEYTADTPEQTVQSEVYLIPFSTFVVLPKTYEIGSNVDVEAIVEDVYYRQLNKREFFKNVSLLINAKVIPC
ncbi:MAG: DUF11 domain-containing protein [Brevinemataceae bacterium]